MKSLAKKVMEMFSPGGQGGVSIAPEVSSGMQDAVERWKRMYQDDPPWMNERVRTLGLPAAISGEIARLATVDMKSQISAPADAQKERAAYLQEQYTRVLADLRRRVEYGIALGGMVIKPFVRGNAIYPDFVNAGAFVAASVDGSGRMTGAVFADEAAVGNKVYMRLESHTLTEQGYLITNTAYESNNGSPGRQVSLDEVPDWAGMESQVVIENVTVPLFAYFKYPAANTVDTDSPLGVSAFARAESLIEQADRQYSRLLWELESSERALYVSDTAFRRDRHGNPELPDRRLYRTLSSQEDLFQDFSPAIRDQSMINALDAILTRIEDVCGLSRGTLSCVQTQARTATELRTMRQRSYATVLDVQRAIENAMRDYVRAMDVWCSVYGLAPEGGYTVSFEFDDSIMVDRGVEFEERRQLVDAGIMHNWEMREWYLGEEKAVAQTALEKL